MQIAAEALMCLCCLIGMQYAGDLLLALYEIRNELRANRQAQEARSAQPLLTREN